MEGRMHDDIGAIEAAIGICETAWRAVVAEQGVGAVSSILWSARGYLSADARRMLTGGGQPGRQDGPARDPRVRPLWPLSWFLGRDVR